MATAMGERKGIDFIGIVKEAAITAFVVFVLALPISGLRTTAEIGGLGVHARWDKVAMYMAIAFVGRIIWSLFLETRGRHRRESSESSIGKHVQKYAHFVGPALIVFAVVLPFMPFADRYILDVSIMVLTYVMLGWGLNIVVGLAGLLDLGYVAFYAVGAYSYALLALNFDLSFWVCLPMAGMFAATFGMILGFPVLRLRGDYLAIVTLGFGEMIRIILINWYSLTKGPDGLSGVPRPSFFGLPFERNPGEGVESFHGFFGIDYSSVHRIIFLYYLILILALITNAFTMRIRKLPVGRAWEALREDETACLSLGINPRNTKLTAFALGAMFGGFAGSFFATRQGFISPESFTFIESAIILMVVVLGGQGSQIGVVLAAVVIIGVPELFRELQEYRMLVFGAAMVLIMIWRPKGLLAFREPTLRLFEVKKSGLFGRKQASEAAE
ncbi:MAG: high-affinity branched-chain amino acid ABC transporter permease LivM [Rhodospirillales bacterium]|nr:high-affinity branched-chain amino acid ABC transporter permease LivM [Rhodospirillales bacterium]